MRLIKPAQSWFRRRLRYFAGAAFVVLSAIPAAAQEPVKLRFWDMIWGPPQYIDAAKGLVDEFNKNHPGVQVEYRSVPWNNWYQTFLTAIGSGTAPDISTGAGYQAVQFYDQGAIRPLDDVVADLKKTGDFDDFQPGAIDTLRYDNHYVALPWGIDIRVWYYRKDLLQAAGQQVPTTWAEFEKVAKATTGKGKYGLVASGDTGGSHYIYSAILNNGGALFSPDRKLTLTRDRNVEAVQAYADMVKEGSVSPASAGYSQDDARAAFERGEAAFLLDTPGVIDAAGPAKAFIGIVPPMTGPHGDKGTIFWVNNIMVYQQTKHPDEVKTFLEWWSKNEKPLWTKGTYRSAPGAQVDRQRPLFCQQRRAVGNHQGLRSNRQNDRLRSQGHLSSSERSRRRRHVPGVCAAALAGQTGQGHLRDGPGAPEGGAEGLESLWLLKSQATGTSRAPPRARLWDRPDLALPILLVAPSADPDARHRGLSDGARLLLRLHQRDLAASRFVRRGAELHDAARLRGLLERGHVQRRIRRRQRCRLLCPGAGARVAAQPRSARARLFPDRASPALDRSLDRGDRQLAVDAGG